MTVIAVCSDGRRRCCMAADSLGTNDDAKVPLKQSKIVRFGNTLVGSEGLYLVQDLLRGLKTKPMRTARDTARKIGDALWITLLHRSSLTEQEGRKTIPGAMLVAQGKHFCLLESNNSVVEIDSDFWAIGSGGSEARGAMFALRHRNPEQRVLAAVEAAIALSEGCGPPVKMDWT